MKVLWVVAHPEPRSLNGSLRDEGVRVLRQRGDEVRVSDLYAMKWKSELDAEDFQADPAVPEETESDLERFSPDRVFLSSESKCAYNSGSLSDEILLEQEKLQWADALIVQFPMWWYGMPAILKGWFDRVFVKGFAYGVKDPRTGQTLKYGEGGLARKRAMVVTTIGAPEASHGPRGINGTVDDLLFPLQHGTFWYVGMEALPPFPVFSADRLSAEDYATVVEELTERLVSLQRTEPIRFRYQNYGDYDEDLVLRPDIARGETGFSAHIRE